MAKKTKTVSVLESEMGPTSLPAEFLRDPATACDAFSAAREGRVFIHSYTDLLNAHSEPVEAPPSPEQAPAVLLPHPLEMAPVNSKIVVTSEGAWLAMPDSVALIQGKDPARRLPIGAKILKVPNGYVTSQLSPTVPTEPKFYKTALEAIGNFVEDHHPRD